jgi:hypothetical protein
VPVPALLTLFMSIEAQLVHVSDPATAAAPPGHTTTPVAGHALPAGHTGSSESAHCGSGTRGGLPGMVMLMVDAAETGV